MTTATVEEETELLDEPIVQSKPKTDSKSKSDAQESDRKPKQLPPYNVIVYNDDVHTFEYVMDTFKKVFGYQKEKCFILAQTIHTTGKAIVWNGSKEVAELKREQIISCGPDLYAAIKVETPLSVSIEPMT